MTKIEKRAAIIDLETRAADDGKRTLVGYAAVFDSPTDIGGYFREKIARGAFANAITADVRALFDHDSAFVLGRTKSGTLRLGEDTRGLRVEIDLPDTQVARDLAVSVDRGDINGMSFSFRAVRQEWDETVEPPLRTLLEVEIDEVSVVTFPAYEDTEVGLRSLQEWRAANRTEIQNPAATPVNRTAANLKQRLSMRLDLKVRTGA